MTAHIKTSSATATWMKASRIIWAEIPSICAEHRPQLDANDDLEIVDEVSFEDGQGWEYDTDDRHVDANSPIPGLPHRHVHALDDPAGFNPDALSRVDYRTKGQGWTPRGNYGEMANGNNWQDTATEQWIRGESVRNTKLLLILSYYSNAANFDPNALQPYETFVPLWLNDGIAPDFNYSTTYTCEISGGKINTAGNSVYSRRLRPRWRLRCQ